MCSCFPRTDRHRSCVSFHDMTDKERLKIHRVIELLLTDDGFDDALAILCDLSGARVGLVDLRTRQMKVVTPLDIEREARRKNKKGRRKAR